MIARYSPYRAWHAVFVASMLFCAAPQLHAQSLGLGQASGGDNAPLEVFADQGIEWHQNDNAYIARGNARAVKGETTVYGDTLTANYRKGASGSTEVWRVEARGNVRIATPNETAYGDLAVYTIDNGVLVMTGKNVRLDTQREKISARDSLEYWEQKNLAVARGEAVVETEDRRIRADVLTAEFKPAGQAGKAPANAKPGAKPPAKPPAKPQSTSATRKPAANGAKTASAAGDENRLQRLDAYGNVIITTADEVARGNRGVYLEETGIATLTGSVKITRGKNQLNGEAAEVNLRTGVSRIVSAKPGSGGPVRALIVPEGKPEVPGTDQGNANTRPITPNAAPRAPSN